MPPAKNTLKGETRIAGRMRSFFVEHRAFSALLFLGVCLRFLHIGWGLPQLYEEAIPLHYGLKFWDLVKSPIDQFFFVYPALTYYIQWMAQAVVFCGGYVTGHYASVAAFLASFEKDPSLLVVVGRSISIIFDAGTIVVAYLTLHKFASKRAAVLAAALLSVNSLHISQAHLINVDTPLTFFSVLLLYLLLSLHREPTFRRYIACGIVVGLAAATKYHAAALVLALILTHLLRARSTADVGRLLAERSLYAALALSGAVFLALNPLIFSHVGNFLEKFSATQAHMEAGHLGIDPGRSTLAYYLLDSLPESLGWILTVTSLASVLAFLVSKERWKYVVLSVPAIYLVILGSWQMRADRYMLMIIRFTDIEWAGHHAAMTASFERRGVLQSRPTVLPVVDGEGKVQGIVHLHDLLGRGEFKFTC